MRRLVLVCALLFCVSARASDLRLLNNALVAQTPTQYSGAFLASGMLGFPIVTLGFARLGRYIDDSSTPKGEVSGSSFERLGVVVGLGASFVGYKFLGSATNVPVSWSSSAAGIGLGLGVGLALLGIDAGVMALFHLKQGDMTPGVLSLVTVIGWSVATTLFIKTDPFKLASGGSSGVGQASAPLVSVSF